MSALLSCPLARYATRVVHGIGTEPRVVDARLKELGWLIPTPQKSVWEFAPR